MGIYKICPRCRKEYEVEKECPNGCYKKIKYMIKPKERMLNYIIAKLGRC